MMGERLVDRERLFYKICLEDKGPPDRLGRRLDAVLDPNWPRRKLAPFKMPKEIAICETLPKTERGKMGRNALVEDWKRSRAG